MTKTKILVSSIPTRWKPNYNKMEHKRKKRKDKTGNHTMMITWKKFFNLSLKPSHTSELITRRIKNSTQYCVLRVRHLKFSEPNSKTTSY